MLHARLAHGAEAFIGTLDDPALAAFARLPPTGRDIAEAARHADGANFLARRGITRALLAQRLGVAPGQAWAGHDQYGAPRLLPFPKPGPGRELRGSGGIPSLHLSLAASQNLFAIAFSPHPVGIDIEPVGVPLDPPWNVLSGSDQARLRALAPDARHLAFLEIWTLREAVLKAHGRGFLGEDSVSAAAPGNHGFFARQQVAGQEVVVALVERQNETGS